MEESTELANNLSERLTNGTYECPVCSEVIQRRDSLWSCAVCYGILHLSCVRFWVKSQAESNAGSAASPSRCASDAFRCPLCQSHAAVASSAGYKCFCGKLSDPPPDPLLVPGSCGQTCGRPRRDPNCTHLCGRMCHPGACPPCARTRWQRCFCGKAERAVGCSSGADGFVCGAVCGRPLDCGRHLCEAPCHEGECPVCVRLVEESCYCGRTQRTRRDGAAAGFACGAVCGRPLDCGRHVCERTCHEGECPVCLRTPSRQQRCPCGKTPLSALLSAPRRSCLDPIPTCGRRCELPLPCGHVCGAECHASAGCPPCGEVLATPCACGGKTIRTPCFCTYLPNEAWAAASRHVGLEAMDLVSPFPPRCGKPCRRPLSCGKHTCREVCCTNADHTCYQICTKRLACGAHACGQLCHKGPCPSCEVAAYERLYCRCRRTWVEPPVPCGTKPPVCNHPCVVPRACGHPANHVCHIEAKCPDCVVPVEKRCGSHGKAMPYFLPCFRQSVSCGAKCGKMLSCCGKTCDKVCHSGTCEHKCTNDFPTLQ